MSISDHLLDQRDGIRKIIQVVHIFMYDENSHRPTVRIKTESSLLQPKNYHSCKNENYTYFEVANVATETCFRDSNSPSIAALLRLSISLS